MRRSDREVKELSDIIKIMEKCDVCRLAFFDEEYPYIIPLNFGFQLKEDQITLYFHGATAGKKYELMSQNSKVCFEMDCSHRLVTTEDTKMCTMEYESVIGNGSLEMVKDDEKYDALCILMKQYRKEDFPFHRDILPQTNVFRLSVKNITGKARMIKTAK